MMRRTEPSRISAARSTGDRPKPTARLVVRLADGVRRRLRAALILLLLSTPLLAGGQATIDWWSVDGGGEIQAEGGDWALSGTVGQWDSTEGNLLIGGSWQLTGGFWALEAPASDTLFVDSFED